jgi:hypothetical protein
MKRLALMLLLASSAASGQEYFRTRVPGKEICLSWNTRELTWYADAAGSARTPGDTEFAALTASFQTWQEVSNGCSDMHFTEGAPVTNPIVGNESGSAGSNVVIFRESACRDLVLSGDPCLATSTCANQYRCWDHSDGTIGLTTATYNLRTGTILDADIELNASPHLDGSSFLFTTVVWPPCSQSRPESTCVAVDIQNTLTHEIGHLIGLDHVNIIGSTMEPAAPLGETSKRVVDTGSVQGFCDTYPRAGPPMPCDEIGLIRRKVVAKNVGTPGLQPIGCSSLLSTPLAMLAGMVVAVVGRRHRPRT